MNWIRHFAIRYLCGVALIFVLGSLASAQQATVRAQRNLVELTNEAAVIVHGRIVSAKVEPHPTLRNLTTVVVTMNVEDSLKGNVSKSYSFRQYVWDIRARYSNMYSKGQELLLFMRPPSRYGLTSPAGLTQGRFAIQRDASGKASALNENGNAGLFARLNETARAKGTTLPAVTQKWSQQTSGAVDLKDLKQTIRAIVGAEQ